MAAPLKKRRTGKMRRKKEKEGECGVSCTSRMALLLIGWCKSRTGSDNKKPHEDVI
jgi:hypothetical protein